jgi:hypothetical protein
MKQYLSTVAFLCTAACGSPFSAEDALVALGDSGGVDVLAEASRDAGQDGGGDVLPAVDAGHDAGSDVADAGQPDGSATDGSSSDGNAACDPITPPVYFMVGVSCAESLGDAGNSYALPVNFILSVEGTSCQKADTPAACQCLETYNCGCMLPALTAENAAHDAGFFCAGALGDCTVDALGVVHVTCN